MQKDVTIYDLLIIGSSDTEESFDCVKWAIEKFNTGVGKEFGTVVVGQNLKDFICAESGGKSSSLIKKQINEKIDVIVAVFWKKYDSGSEDRYLSVAEEFKLILESDKPEFVYFLVKEIIPSEQNAKDLEKIKKFQNEYSKIKGIPLIVRNEYELKERLLSDLSSYFEKVIIDKNIKLQKKVVDSDFTYLQKGQYYLPYGCIGRDEKIKLLDKFIRENSRPVVVKGVTGVGKTAFCSYYYQLRNEGNQKFSMLFINLENSTSKADFIHAVCAALRVREAFVSLDSILELICSGERNYDALFFDNWEDFQFGSQGSIDFQCVCRFITTLVSNRYIVLISSQVKAPFEWKEFELPVLKSDDGRKLFTDLLGRREKYVDLMSVSEEKAFEYLLNVMENHPLTIVLISSLLESSNDSLERIENKWSEVCNSLEIERHRSMKIALKMSYEAISKTPGASILWGIVAELNTDFPIYFLDILQQIYQEIEWDEARKALSDRSLIQFSDNKSLHMLMPVKAQWKNLTEETEKEKCFELLTELMEYVAKQADTSEYTKNPDLSNHIRGIMLDCMRSFMLFTELLIVQDKTGLAERCINAMQEYYESLSDSAFEFLDELPLEKFSLDTKGMVLKCKGDICRLGKKDKPEIADKYYEEALECFKQSGNNIWYAQTLNVIGKNYFWSLHNAPKAIAYQIKSEKLSCNVSYNRGIAEAKKDLAIILIEEYKKYDEAMTLLNKALPLYEEVGDYRGTAHVLKRQGTIMWNRGQYDDAIEKYDEALNYYRQAHYIQGQGDTLSRMCMGYIKLNNRVKLQETIEESEILMDKIPYQIIKNDLADKIKKGKNWMLKEQELN